MTAIGAVTTTGETSALCHSVGLARASFYRRGPTASVAPTGPRPPRAPSPRALGPVERQAILDTLHSERFLDQSPAEVHATLLEEQQYLGSVRTMYRVLAAADEVRERRDQARHPVYAQPELVATAPNQVWSWDITKLKGPIPYLYYSLYVVLDSCGASGYVELRPEAQASVGFRCLRLHIIGVASQRLKPRED